MSDRPTVRSATEQLTEAIRESDEFLQYKALKDSVMVSDTNRALLKEYQRTQTRLQMAAADKSEEIMRRAQKQPGLLAQYLLMQAAYDGNDERAFRLATVMNDFSSPLQVPGSGTSLVV